VLLCNLKVIKAVKSAGNIDFKAIGKNMSIPNLNGQLIIEQIRKTFGL